MLVYGDPRYVISGAEARGRLRGFYDRAASGSIDAARDLVIALGQVEQGLADLANMQAKDESLTTLMEACDAAAERFVAKVLKKDSSADTPQRNKAALQGLDGLDAIGELEIKIPEGFAFYSLYPEQYVAAAESFTSRRSITPTLVVGIRSIGTTLSATVKAALAARGFPVERITVRPGGHPFARKTEIDTAPNAEAVIIVDEGPGLSGSSMASAAAAFRERGLTDITFFPSHAKPPGASASEETRRIWSETPCIVMPLLDGDPGSGPVMAALRHETEHLLGAPVCSVEDLSAGAWTRHVASGKAARSAPQFERSKFLIRCGKGRGALWKYAGLGPGEKLESFVTSSVARQNALAAKSWCSPALGEHFGFVATEWREGRGLATDLLHDSIPGRIAQYISDVSKPPLALEICHDGIERLREMTRCNLAEAGLKNLCVGQIPFLKSNKLLNCQLII